MADTKEEESVMSEVPPVDPMSTPPLTEEEKKQRAKDKKKRQKEKKAAEEAAALTVLPEGAPTPEGYHRLFTESEKAELKKMTPGQKRRFIQRRKEEMALEVAISGKITPGTPSAEVAAMKELYRSVRKYTPDKVHGNMTSMTRQAKKIIRESLPHAAANIGEEHWEGLEIMKERFMEAADRKRAAEAAEKAAKAAKVQDKDEYT